MTKELTCKDCTYHESYDRFVMKCMRDNTKYEDKKTCWYFEPKENHCVTPSEQKSHNEYMNDDSDFCFEETSQNEGQVFDNGKSQANPNEYIKELQAASNLLLHAEQLVSLQEYYEKLKNMGSEIPETVIYANTSMGIDFHFYVDPIDAFEFLKKQLTKQTKLLRAKIEVLNQEDEE